jgi:hypothetical protein
VLSLLYEKQQSLLVAALDRSITDAQFEDLRMQTLQWNQTEGDDIVNGVLGHMRDELDTKRLDAG